MKEELIVRGRTRVVVVENTPARASFKAPTVLYSIPYIYSKYRMCIGICIGSTRGSILYSKYTIYTILYG